MNCYIHPDRPATRSCTECGISICRLCTFEEVIGRRVLRTTSIDIEVQLDYGFFCPSCFIHYAEKEGYHNPKGALTRYRPYRGLIVSLWFFFILGFVANFFMFGFGYMFWVLTILMMIYIKSLTIKNYKRYQSALEITGAKPKLK